MPSTSSQILSGENTQTDIDLEYSTDFNKPSFWRGLLTPEGLIMFPLAVIIDIIEIVCDVFVESFIIAAVLDAVAYLLIGGWMLVRGSNAKVSERSVKTLQQVSTKMAKTEKWVRWARITAPLFELIPFVSIVPCWAIAVYIELKYGNSV